MLTKRTQILFDELLWNHLTEVAKDRNTSVGELVRSAVRKQYVGDASDLKRVVDEIRKFRDTRGKQLGKGEESTAIIRKMRDERYGQKHLRRLGSY